MESQAKQDGRNMIMVIGPHRKKSETKAHVPSPASPARPVPGPRPAAAEANGTAAADDGAIADSA